MQVKTRQAAAGTGLGVKKLSENEQLLEYLIKRFEESECRMEADTQKRQSDIKKKSRKFKKREKKSMERFGETRKHKGQDQSNTADKKQSRKCSSEVIFREKLEHDCHFRSEDL